MKNILVTGAAGFIGSNFAEIANDNGFKIIILDAFTYAGHDVNLVWTKNRDNVEIIKGDICNGNLVSDLLKRHDIDYIVNFAAESHVDNSISSPDAFIQTNIVGVYTLLEAARIYYNQLNSYKKNVFRFIQISTDEVYGSLELEDTRKFDETSQYRPSSPYSASKAAGDHLAQAWYKTYGLPVIVTNCSNNYGPKQFPEKLIPHMILCAINGKSLPVYGDGKNIRDWIHVYDHSQGILLALSNGEIGQTYCFGGRSEVANIDLVRQICTILDDLKPLNDNTSYQKYITFVKDRAGHDRRYAINDIKAETELGFKRKYTFQTGLKETVEWYLRRV